MPRTTTAPEDAHVVYERLMLAQLERQAFDAQNFPLLDFYLNIDRELVRLRTLSRIVASMYHHGLSDDRWEQLFEALADANLLTEKKNEGNPSSEEETK